MWLMDPDTCDLAAGDDCGIPIADKQQEVCQKIRACLLLQKGESLFNPDAGIDWCDDFYANFRNRDEIDIRLRAKIEGLDGVDFVELSEISFDQVTRLITYKWGIRIDGEYFSGEENA